MVERADMLVSSDLALVDEVGFVSVESWKALSRQAESDPSHWWSGSASTGKNQSALHRLHVLHAEGTHLPGHTRVN